MTKYGSDYQPLGYDGYGAPMYEWQVDDASLLNSRLPRADTNSRAMR